MRNRLVVFMILTIGVLAYSASANRGRHNDATETYGVQYIEGWKVFVSDRLLHDGELATEVLKELQTQLFRITKLVPEKQLTQLKKISIWLELSNWDRCQYHPNGQWLAQNNYNPDKAGAVEISNARSFLQWGKERDILVLLHELAHGYHHQVLGNDDERIRKAYRAAVESEKYEEVLRDTGGMIRHYALSNPQEYFAELTETYLARNDYFPFTRIELQEFDPMGYELMREIWGEK